MLSLTLATLLFAADPVFKAGFAERDITPPIGSEHPGGYGKSYHTRIHGACKVRAAVFDDGTNVVALVGLDALGVEASSVAAARAAIHAKAGIPPHAVLFGASHSHSSGPLSGVMPGAYDAAPEFERKLAYQHTTCVHPGYLKHCEAMMAEAVIDAHAKRVPVRAGVGTGKAEGVAFNRRFRMRDGRTITHPGQGNPAILEPAGPVDPEVGVIGAWNAEGKLLGCVVNFACHATTSAPGISANYVEYVEKAVRGYFGAEAVVVFLNGASGDVTQVDNRSPHKMPDGDTQAQRLGGTVGLEAAKALLQMPRGSLAPVGAKHEVLKIARRQPSAERVAAARKLAEQDPKKSDPTAWTFAKETVLLAWNLERQPVVDAEVQAVQVGPAVFLTTPAEYFCRYGMEQKAKSAFKHTFPVSLANGCVGYVPTTDAFNDDGGGYETRLTNYSNLRIDAGDLLRDAGLKLAAGFAPGPAPRHPAAAAFSGKAWTYGDVRPER